MLLEKPSQTGFEAVPRTPTFDYDEEVITVAGEAVAAPFQFPIQVVSHEVGQHRRQGRPVRDPFFRGLEALANQHARAQRLADQP